MSSYTKAGISRPSEEAGAHPHGHPRVQPPTITHGHEQERAPARMETTPRRWAHRQATTPRCQHRGNHARATQSKARPGLEPPKQEAPEPPTESLSDRRVKQLHPHDHDNVEAQGANKPSTPKAQPNSKRRSDTRCTTHNRAQGARHPHDKVRGATQDKLA